MGENIISLQRLLLKLLSSVSFFSAHSSRTWDPSTVCWPSFSISLNSCSPSSLMHFTELPPWSQAYLLGSFSHQKLSFPGCLLRALDHHTLASFLVFLSPLFPITSWSQYLFPALSSGSSAEPLPLPPSPTKFPWIHLSRWVFPAHLLFCTFESSPVGPASMFSWPALRPSAWLFFSKGHTHTLGRKGCILGSWKFDFTLNSDGFLSFLFCRSLLYIKKKNPGKYLKLVFS